MVNVTLDSLDLDLIVQRILKLAEIAMLEHLEAVQRSQAQGLLNQFDASEGKGA